MQPVSATLLAILNAIIATGAPYDPAATFVGLFTGINNRGPQTQLSDLTLAPGTFGAAIAITTWGTPYWLNSGQPVVDGATKIFAPASGADDCIVNGWYLADAATSGNLLAFAMLGTNVTLSYSPLKKLSLVVRLTPPLNGGWDASTFWNG